MKVSRYFFVLIVISLAIQVFLPHQTYAKSWEIIDQSPYLEKGAPYEMYEYYPDDFDKEQFHGVDPRVLITKQAARTYSCVDPQTSSGRILGRSSLVTTWVEDSTNRLLARLTEYDNNKVVTFCKPNTCKSTPGPYGGDRRAFAYTTSCSLSIASGGQCDVDSDCRSNHCNSFHKCDAADLVPGFEKTNPDPIDDYFGSPFLNPELGDGEMPLISPDPIEPTGGPISPAELITSCANLSCGNGQTCMSDIWGAYCADKLIEGMYCTSTSQCADNLTCNTSTSTCTSDETVPPASSENNDTNSESQFCNAEESYCTGDSQEPCQCSNGKQCDSESVLFCQDYL